MAARASAGNTVNRSPYDVRKWFARINTMRADLENSMQPFSPEVGETDLFEYTVDPEGKGCNLSVITCTKACNCSTGVMRLFESPAHEEAMLEGLKELYEREWDNWMESEGFLELKKALGERLDTNSDAGIHDVAGNPVNVDCCVALGLGSFSDQMEECYSLRSVQQLVLFMSMVKVISSRQSDSPPQLYAQEPNFNDMDRGLLSSIGVTTVNHPTGFNMITCNSLAFCPGAEQFVDLRTLIRDPKVYVGSDLETWVDEQGRLRSFYVSRLISKKRERRFKATEKNAEPVESDASKTVVDDEGAIGDGQENKSNGMSEGHSLNGQEEKGGEDEDEDEWEDEDEDEDEDEEEEEDENGDEDEDPDSLIIFDDCARHTAEFVQKFMKSGRTRYRLPTACIDDERLISLIWRE